jgi:cysteine-rich repeat protein
MYGDMSGSDDSIYDFRNNVVSEWGFEGTIWRGAGGGISTAKGNAINNKYLCTGSCPKNSGMVQVAGTSNVWPNVHTSGNEKPSGATANYNPGTASLFSVAPAVTTQSANDAANLVLACAGAWPRNAADQAFAGPLDTAQCGGSPPPPATCGDGIVDAGEACDDTNTENCDGCKGDCSAVETQTAWYPDNDADSFGDILASANSQYCQPAGEVADNTDCDDDDAAIHPNATEQCSDSIDNNCNGQVDEGCGGSSDCQSLWGHLADFMICNEDPIANTCEFHNNVPGTTCEEVCTDAGGTCFGANRTQLGSYGACYPRGGLSCSSGAYANDRKCFCNMP